MTRQLFLALGVVLFLVASFEAIVSFTAGRDEPPASRPNIILLSIDCLRKESFRTDDPRLPGFAALAERSVVFDRAVSPASWTLPAHAALMTGLYPDRNGATDKRLRMSPGVPSLALSLWQAGYETVGFNDKGFLDRQFGFGRGFERYNEWRVRPDPALDAALPRGGDATGLPGSDLFDRAEAFLAQRQRPARPFFLFLHTFAVHDYFHAHPWTVSRLPPFPDHPLGYNLECMVGVRSCAAEDWQRLEALYEAEVEHAEEGLSRLLAALAATGQQESTLFVLLSDHGEGFDVPRHRVHHGGRLHRDLLEVPLLIAGAGLTPRVVDGEVSLVDLAPTLLELAGVPPPEGLDGQSVAAAVRGEAPLPARTLYAMEHAMWWTDGRREEAPSPRKNRIAIAAIDGKWWYIQSRAGEELYDVAGDRAQSRNLAADPAALRDLTRFREAVRGRGTVIPSMVLREPDREIEKQLRSLGYIR